MPKPQNQTFVRNFLSILITMSGLTDEILYTTHISLLLFLGVKCRIKISGQLYSNSNISHYRVNRPRCLRFWRSFRGIMCQNNFFPQNILLRMRTDFKIWITCHQKTPLLTFVCVEIWHVQYSEHMQHILKMSSQTDIAFLKKIGNTFFNLQSGAHWQP